MSFEDAGGASCSVQKGYSNVTKGTLGRSTTDGEVVKLCERNVGRPLRVSRGCGWTDTSARVSEGLAVASRPRRQRGRAVSS